MANVNRNTLKSWFVRGAKPLAAQFADWIDSFWHKEDTLPIGSVENLTDELNKRATAESVRNVETRVATLENATHVSAHADLTGKNEEADVQHLTAAEKSIINETRPIEFGAVDCLNGIILLQPFKRLYKITTSTALNISINASQIDLTKFIRFNLKINFNAYVSLTFPPNWFFNNFAVPAEIGEYVYEFNSSDGGATWHAVLMYRNVTTVGTDQSGNEIMGSHTWYVDGEKTDNSGNGLSWATAVKDVQVAIDRATTGDAVFVKGTLAGLKYLPTTQRDLNDNRSKSFIMKSGVNIYGGFKGDEISIYQREMVSYAQVMKLPSGTQQMLIDIPKYRTVLSGEIAGESIIDNNSTGCKFTEASMSNNSKIVIYAKNLNGKTIFNGFEVIGGNSSNNNESIISAAVNLYFSNNIIEKNRSAGNIISNSLLSNNLIRCNTALSNSAISGCECNRIIVSENDVDTAFLSSTCSDCVAFNNRANGFNNGTAINCIAYGNRYTGFISVKTVNCASYDNLGIGYVRSNSINSKAWGNVSGGFSEVSPAINCEAINNNNFGFKNCKLINCASVRNSSNQLGAGTYNCEMHNSVIYGNRAGSGAKSNVYNDNNSAETYSAFEDEARPGAGNISLSANNVGDANSPYFFLLSAQAGIVDELQLSIVDINSAASALIDKGNNADNAAGLGAVYDIKMLKRKDASSGLIDIGAMEWQK